MTDSILIISKVDSFMVNAIKVKLESSGFNCEFESTDSPTINKSIDEKRVIVLYVALIPLKEKLH